LYDYKGRGGGTNRIKVRGQGASNYYLK